MRILNYNFFFYVTGEKDDRDLVIYFIEMRSENTKR